jgi:hypothetical protein
LEVRHLEACLHLEARQLVPYSAARVQFLESYFLLEVRLLEVRLLEVWLLEVQLLLRELLLEEAQLRVLLALEALVLACFQPGQAEQVEQQEVRGERQVARFARQLLY